MAIQTTKSRQNPTLRTVESVSNRKNATLLTVEDAFCGKTPQSFLRQDAAKLFTARRRKKVILYLQGRRGFPRRHDVVAPRRFGVSKDIEPSNVSRVTTGRQRGGNGRQRAATGGKKRQRAAKGGKGRQRGGVSQPCGGKELPVLRLHDTAGMVAPLKGVRTINLGRFRAEKSAALPGRFMCAAKVRYQGGVRYNDATPPGWLLL